MKKVKLLMPIIGIPALGTAIAPIALTGCAQQKWTITIEAGEHGTVSKKSIEVANGSTWGSVKSQIEATPDADYHLKQWEKDGVALEDSFVINANFTAKAVFVINFLTQAQWETSLNNILDVNESRNYKLSTIKTEGTEYVYNDLYWCVGKQCKMTIEDDTYFEDTDAKTPGYLWRSKKNQDDNNTYVDKLCYTEKSCAVLQLDDIKLLSTKVYGSFKKTTFDEAKKTYTLVDGNSTFKLTYNDNKQLVKYELTTKEYETDVGYSSTFTYGGQTIDSHTIQNKLNGTDTATENKISTVQHSPTGSNDYYYLFEMPKTGYNKTKGITASFDDLTVNKSFTIYINRTKVEDATLDEDNKIITFGSTKPEPEYLVIIRVKPSAGANKKFTLEYNIGE